MMLSLLRYEEQQGETVNAEYCRLQLLVFAGNG